MLQLTSDGTYTYAYDANCNVIWKNGTNTVRYNYIYDSFGQMTEVKRQTYSGGWGPLTTIALYCYDANGARAKTDESGTILRYVYSGHDPMYYNSTDGKGHKDIYLGGRQELRIVSPTEKWAYMADALGSVRKVLQNGRPGSATFSAVTYKPFGPVVTTTGSDKFTYAGEMQDSSTGLVYLFARYYDPELGRFYALDSEVGDPHLPQTLNRYAYCLNSPLIYHDATGKNAILIAFTIAAAEIGFKLGVLDAVLSGHPKDWFEYGAAGAITWAQFPIIAYYGPKNELFWRYGALPYFSGQYAFWKTGFTTGDWAKAAEEGAIGAAIGFAWSVLFRGMPPVAGQVWGQIMTGLFKGILSSVGTQYGKQLLKNPLETMVDTQLSIAFPGPMLVASAFNYGSHHQGSLESALFIGLKSIVGYTK